MRQKWCSVEKSSQRWDIVVLQVRFVFSLQCNKCSVQICQPIPHFIQKLSPLANFLNDHCEFSFKLSEFLINSKSLPLSWKRQNYSFKKPILPQFHSNEIQRSSFIRTNLIGFFLYLISTDSKCHIVECSFCTSASKKKIASNVLIIAFFQSLPHENSRMKRKKETLFSPFLALLRS